MSSESAFSSRFTALSPCRFQRRGNGAIGKGDRQATVDLDSALLMICLCLQIDETDHYTMYKVEVKGGGRVEGEVGDVRRVPGVYNLIPRHHLHLISLFYHSLSLDMSPTKPRVCPD